MPFREGFTGHPSQGFYMRLSGLGGTAAALQFGMRADTAPATLLLDGILKKQWAPRPQREREVISKAALTNAKNMGVGKMLV